MKRPRSLRAQPDHPSGKRKRARRDTTQAQLIVGVPALERDHPDAWILAVLNAILGDGMSSRLFLQVREAQGLAYDVSSGLVDYADAGSMEVSAGVDPERLPAALDAVLVELARLRDEPVPEDELAKTKAYLSGGLELRMEETRHLASWVGGQEALHDRVLDLDEALAHVASVSAADIQRLAGELFRDDGLRLAVVAPARHLRGLERRLRLPA
jgi:predicted Zn-dependent peptidase